MRANYVNLRFRTQKNQLVGKRVKTAFWKLDFGKDTNMKVQTERPEVKALAIPFRALMQRAVVPSLVVPRQERAAITVLAPSLHSAELERRRKQEEMERREQERELRRRRQMQQAVHSVD
jgi:non-ribosomal peptide synthetase component E (peptide arylation enzyme)